MPFKIKKAIMAIKLEASPGTPEVLAAADAFRAFDISIDDDINMNERQGVQETTLSPMPDVAGYMLGKISGKFEIKGSGSAGVAPDYGEVLKACGMSETIVAVTSVTYKPSDASDVFTMAAYEDGVKYFIAGAMGNIKFSLTGGGIGVGEFEMSGIYQRPADVAQLASTSLDTTIPPAIKGASAFTWNAQNVICASAEFDIGQQVVLREDITKAKGYITAFIVDRKPVGNFTPEMIAVATYDFHADWEDNSERALIVGDIGGTAGNKYKFTVNKAQITKIGKGDREGIRVIPCDIKMNRNAVAGDDELELLFT